MSNDTTFVNGTVITADWLNDVNDHVFLGEEFDPITVINVKDPTYGAKGDNTTDDTVAIQAAINAVATGGAVFFPAGTYKITGSLTISNANVKLFGTGRKSSLLSQTTTSSKTLVITAEKFTLQSLGITYPGTGVSGGTAIYSTHFYGVYSDFYINRPFIGVHFDTGANSNVVSDFEVENYISIGVYISSGAANISVNTFFLICDDTVTYGILGAIRLQNQVEGCTFSNGQLFQGVYSMTTDAASYTMGNRPAYNKFTNVFFDSSLGTIIDKVVDFDFTSCWFSNRASGAVLTTCDGIRFIGGGAINNTLHGVLVQNTAVRVTFDSFAARGNSTGTANTSSGIIFAANTTDFSVINCVLGSDAPLSFGSQKYGLEIQVGTSDRYAVIGNFVTGNTTAGIIDGGTGTEKYIKNNIGYKNIAQGATSVANGGTVTHGLVATPTRVRATPSVSGEMVSVTALGATTFTVAIIKNDGTAGTTQTIYWEAEV